MSIDYDVPRSVADDEAAEPLEALQTDKASDKAAVIDLDEAELADRLADRLITQINQILNINKRDHLTPKAVDAAQEALLIGH